jgi:hypothetical protein
MNPVDLSREAQEALRRLGQENRQSPAVVLDELLRIPPFAPEAAEPLARYLTAPAFRRHPGSDDRYLSLLEWIAAQHPAELGEFIRSQDTGAHSTGLSARDVIEICRRNESRQIDGTPFWAVMNLPFAAKRRFAARVLEFIGYREGVIRFACALLGDGGRLSAAQTLAA